MATVTKPIALNETFKTTESTPRNLADVLAQALQALNTTISGLNFINCVVVQTLPTTGISTTTIYLVPKNPAQTDNLYDEYINLTGTSAGWEKIGDTEIDLSDYYNKTETDTLLSGKVDKEVGKGLSTNDYTTAEKTKLAGIEAGAEVNPTSGVKTATELFETVDGGLLSKCMINLVPVQSGSGDPYPAGGGKNKLGLPYKDTSGSSGGITRTINNDGTVRFYGTATGDVYWTFKGDEVPFTLPAGTYTWSTANPIPDGVAIYYSGTYLNASNQSRTFTFTEETTSSIFIQIPPNAGAVDFTVKMQIELGSTATPWTPYSNIRPISGHTEVDLDVKDGDNVTQHTYQVQIGSTVYGGYVDLVSGVMTVTHGYVDLGTLTWGTPYGTNDPNKYRMRSNDIVGIVKNQIATGIPANILCSEFKSISADATYTRNEGISIGPTGIIIVYDSRYDTSSSASAFQSAMSGVQLCYELATPEPLQLTPQQIETLVGQNNLSTPLSGQSIEPNGVEYKELFTFADVKEYVDKKIPDAPTTDGTYTLQAVVSGGVPTYSWV